MTNPNKKKKLIIRTAKLLSDARRSKIDAGVAIAYEHQPVDLDEKKHGSLFAVIEIAGPINSSQEIVELIIDNLHNEYYRDLDRDPLESFEAALSRINEELTDVTEQGKIHWLGKLNAILSVISDKTLHLTQAGGAESYLFRKNNMSHISKDLTGDSINPLRTFINIASGELSEDDKVCFFSPGIFHSISKEEIQKYITEFNPNTSISHLKSLIEDIDNQKRSSALIIEVLTPETLSNYTIDDDPDEVWITDSKKGIDAIAKGVSPLIMTAGKKTADFTSTFLDFIKLSFIPAITNVISSIPAKISSIKRPSDSNKKENVFIKPKEAISSERFHEEFFDGDNEEISNIEFTSQDKEEEEAPQSSLTEKPERTSLVYSTFDKFSSSVKKTGDMVHLPKNKNYKKILIIGAIAILVIGSIFSINGKVKDRRIKAATEKYQEASKKYDDANNLLILDNKEEAIKLYNEAEDLAKQVQKTGYLKKEIEDLIAKISAKEEQAQGITNDSGEVFSDLDKVKATGLLGIQKLGDNFYSINSNTGAVYEITVDGTASEIINEFTFDGKPISAVGVEETDKIVILTDAPALYEFVPKSKEIFKLKVSGDLEKGTALSSFGSNIYILSPEDSTIFKHIKITGGYGEKSNYIKKTNDFNVGSGVSIAIDGNLYVLSKEGNIIKFASGIQKDFEIKGLPQKPDESSIIYANSEASGLFILNKNKKSVTITDKNFNFVKQIVSDKFSDLKGVYAENGSLYVLSGTKIYKIGL